MKLKPKLVIKAKITRADGTIEYKTIEQEVK